MLTAPTAPHAQLSLGLCSGYALLPPNQQAQPAERLHHFKGSGTIQGEVLTAFAVSRERLQPPQLSVYA